MKPEKIVFLVLALVFFSFLVWATNCTPLGYFLTRNHTYSNYNGTYQFVHGNKGITYTNLDSGYTDFLKEHPNIQDKQIYRTYWLSPWRFWEWHHWYYHSDRMQLPYLSKSEIERNRKAEGLPKIQLW